MGWEYGSYWQPYVTVSARRAHAKRDAAKLESDGTALSPIKISGRKITNSFWGNSWCENLECYSDYANRLPRGRSYVRNGSVLDLQISTGKITALVSGSQIYKIEISIADLDRSIWTRIKSDCAGRIGSMIELLRGKLSKEVMEVVTDRNNGLFPKPGQIKMKCSCPDSALLCKHLAAVLYGVGARLDSKPELLFQLRHVDHLELIEGIAGGIANDKKLGSEAALNDSELSDIFGIEISGDDHVTTSDPLGRKAPKRKRQPSSRSSRSTSSRSSKSPARETAAKSRAPAGLTEQSTELEQQKRKPTARKSGNAVSTVEVGKPNRSINSKKSTTTQPPAKQTRKADRPAGTRLEKQQEAATSQKRAKLSNTKPTTGRSGKSR